MDSAALLGLGLPTTTTPITMPTFNAGSVQASVPASSGGSFWTNLASGISKVTNVVKTGASVIQQGKSTLDLLKQKTQAAQQGTTQQQTQTSQGSSTPPPAVDEGMSTTAKVLIGVSVAAAIGSGIYLVVANKKKGRGLGCPCEDDKIIDTKAEVVSSELNGPKKSKRKR